MAQVSGPDQASPRDLAAAQTRAGYSSEPQTDTTTDAHRLSPMLAAGAMALSSVFGVTNALRLRRAG